MLKLVLTAFILLQATAAHAASYNCTTEFGETVPLAVVRDGKRSEWNAHVRKLPGKAQVKARKISDKETLETRYMTQAGPAFKFEMGKKFEVELSPPQGLLDRRLPEAKGLVKVGATDRESFGLIVRVSKSAVPLANGGTVPVSASGEAKLFGEEKELILDVGVDEHVALADGKFERLAALEVKIRCHRGRQ